MASTARQQPKDRISQAVANRGPESFVAGCVLLLQGTDEEPALQDLALIDILGGTHAWAVLESGPRPDQAYWLRVWAMRGLLWCHRSEADDQIVRSLDDSAWRVREMAAKVCARHQIGAAAAALAHRRLDDDNARVRAAADRAWHLIADDPST